MFGNLPAIEVTRPMIREFRDAIATCARNMPRTVRAMTFKEQLAWSAERPNVKKLSRRTVNRKGIGSMSACMHAAIMDEIRADNPCSKQDLPLRKSDKVVRLPYSLEDLIKIFGTRVYTEEQKRWVGGAGEAAFWIPLIALFAGARLEEIGQLLCSDIQMEEGIHFFDLMDLSDEDEDEYNKDERHHVKKLKTSDARRRVPIHPQLVELGFLDYVAVMCSQGRRSLFPNLKEYRGRMTHNWSKWWARHTDLFVTTSPSKVFHSLRHKFIDRMRNQMLNRDVLKAIVGHSNGDTTDHYGESISLESRYEELVKLTYPGLDLSHVKANYRFC
jgi:integrase